MLSCTGKGVEHSLPGGALVGAVVDAVGGVEVPLDDVDEGEVLEAEGDVLLHSADCKCRAITV